MAATATIPTITPAQIVLITTEILADAAACRSAASGVAERFSGVAERFMARARKLSDPARMANLQADCGSLALAKAGADAVHSRRGPLLGRRGSVISGALA